MPIYRYVCPKCSKEKKFFVSELSEADKERICICGFALKRTMGIPDAIEMETCDNYRGNKRFADTERKMDERSHEHWKKHDLPKIIEKHGIEFAVRQGWVNDDGSAK